MRKSGRVFRDAAGRITGALEVVWSDEDRISAQGRDARERECIVRALLEARYHRGKAAKALGMSRTTLWRKMKQHGL
ncbi:MAG: hypothetical protein HKN73_03485 [Gemmatimonadetes bacterium]|nr:hypothetical protein [Gemmatimonadota bacterium]